MVLPLSGNYLVTIVFNINSNERDEHNTRELNDISGAEFSPIWELLNY